MRLSTTHIGRLLSITSTKAGAARTLLLLGALLGAIGLISIVGTRARTRPSQAPPPSAELSRALSSNTVQLSAHSRVRGPLRLAAKSQVNPFDFRANHAFSILLVPMLSATKDAVLANDVTGNSVVNPGDTLRYTVTITNAMGAMAATGVNFTDTIDANTTFVGGTLKASPIAVNDPSYQTIGNVPFTVNAAQGVLANDFDANVPAPCSMGGACVIAQVNGSAFVSGSPVATTNGTVTVNSDGSFTYAPNANFRGPTDSFTYTLGNGTGLTDMATVTVSVSGMIWFVNANAAMNGNGRLDTPFNCLTGAGCLSAAARMAGDNVFLYSSGTSYTGGLTLLNNERLIGQAANSPLIGAGSITGLSAPLGTTTLPSTGGSAVTITTSAAATNGVNVAMGNTIRGITFGNTTGADIAGSGFGTLTIGPAMGASDVTLNGNGQALSLTNGTLAARIASISSTNSAGPGILLDATAGSLVSGSTTITNPTGIGINVTDSNTGAAPPSSVNVDFANTNVSMSGGTGVSLSNNTGTLTFADLDIAPDTGQRGLHAVDNSGTITSTSGTINAPNSAAVQITRSSSTTLLNVTLTSVSSAGGTLPGIALTNTSGSFTVTGSGGGCTSSATCTGGSISGKTGSFEATGTPGVRLINVTNFRLTRINISGNNHSGIYGGIVSNPSGAIDPSTINGFQLDACNITGNGNDTLSNPDETGVDIYNLVGTAPGGSNPTSITNTTISNNREMDLQITNATSTALTNLQMSGNTISNNGAGAVAVLFNFLGSPLGTANMTLNLTSGTFTGNAPNTADGVHCDHSGTAGLMTCNVSGATFTNNNVGVNTSVSQGANLNFTVQNNTATGNRAHGLNFFANAASTGTVNGKFLSNTVGTSGVIGSGSSLGNGIRVQNESEQNAGVLNVLINGNTVQEVAAGTGVIVFQGITGSGTTTGKSTNATITNNTIRDIDAGRAIAVQQNDNDPGATSTTCVDVSGNEMNNIAGLTPPGDGSKIRLRQLQSATFFLRQTNASGVATANSPPNGVATTTTTAAQVAIGGTMTPTSGCTQPSNFAAPIDTEGAPELRQQGDQNGQANDGSAAPNLLARVNEEAVDVAQMLEQLTGTKAHWLSYLNPTGATRTNGGGLRSTSVKRALQPAFSAFATSLSYFNPLNLFERPAAAATLEEKAAPVNQPTAQPVAAHMAGNSAPVATATSAAFSGETINKMLGTLPPGENIRVVFDVTVDSPFPAGDFSVANFASIGAAGGISITSDTETTTVVQPPTISKAFASDFVAKSGTVNLAFTITNPNPSTNFTQVAFSDVLPVGLNVANGSTAQCGGGTLTTTAATRTIALAGGSINANSNCTFTVAITAGTAEGLLTNTSNAVSSLQGGAGGTATDTITVIDPPSLSKSFTPNAIPLNGTSTLQFTLSNPNTTLTLNTLSFTDSLPAGVTTPDVGPTTVCGNGSYSVTSNVLTFTKPSLGPGAGNQCVFSITVTGTTTGQKTNTTSTVTTSNSNAGAAATAMLEVIAPPTVMKGFATSPITLGASTTMSFLLTNPNATTTLNGIGFSDTLPAGITVVSATSPQCGGTVTTTSSSVTFSGGTLAGGANCTVNITVMGAQAGSWPNTATNVVSTEGGAGVNSNTATIVVVGPPVISKAFGAANIAVGGTTSLTFTIQNPAANTVGLTGIAFTDTLPAGLVVATPNGLSGMCGGTVTAVAGSGSISLTGGSLGVGGSCTIAVNVTGTTSGVKNNVSGNVTSTNGGTGNQAMASVTVASPPMLTKDFVETQIPLGGTATLNFTISNPNGAVTLNNISFNDPFPGGLEVDATPMASNTCGGTFTTTAGATSVSLSGAMLAGGGSCTLSVKVKGTTAGNKNNTTGAISSTETGAGGTASDSITVVGPPPMSKVFGAANIAVGGTTSLIFTINNPSTVTQTGISFTDNLPAGLVVATPNGLTGMCNGTVTATPGSGTISLSGGSLAGGGTCTIIVNVTGTAPGLQVNTTGAISSTEGGTGGTASATINVFAPATVVKSFAPTSVALNGVSTLTIMLTNPAANPGGLSGLSFTDAFPGGLEVDATPMASNTCGGTFAPAAMATSISLSGGALAAAGGSCQLSVKVKGTTAGPKVNNVTVNSTEGGASAQASATLNVGATPGFTKTFVPAEVKLNELSTLTFNLTNPNGFQITGVAFSDTLPSDLVLDANPMASNTCNGTLTAAANTNVISLSGGSINANNACQISVKVKAPTAGAKNNVSGAITTNETGTGGTAAATLAVVAPPQISKAFSPTSILTGPSAFSTLTFTITNPAGNTVALTGVGFVDNLPAGLIVATPNNLSNNCSGGTVSAVAGSGVISLSGATINAGTSCTVVANVTATSAGAKVNTSEAVTSTNGGTGNTASATLNVSCPAITVNPATVPNGGVGVAYTATNFSAMGGGGTYTFSLSSGTLPNGLGLTGNTLSGTPTEGGSFNITIKATDQFGCMGTRDFTLVINRPPVLAPIGNKAVAPNQTLTFTAMATDPDPGQTLTFSLVGAPAGATINPMTGQFSWTPTPAQTGMHTFTVVVTDNGSPALSDSETITVTVGNLTPTISLAVSFLNTNPTNVGLAAQLTDSFSGAPIPGKTITFQIGNLTTTGVTDGNGNANATIQVAAPGTYAAKATFAGDPSFPMAMAVTSFNVTVGGQSCNFTIAPTSQSFAANGGTGTVALTTPASNCNWSAASTVPWITLTGTLSGTGNGTVSYTVGANPDPMPRSGTINIAGLSFTVVQGFQFLDVPVGSLFYTEIGKLAARGVTLGCGGGNYCPNDVVSRQQMAAFIIRALGDFNPPPPALQRFADVPPNNIFYAFIEQMAIRQITLGCGGGNYCPADPVTRQSMAAFLIRALHAPGYLPPAPAQQRFQDVPPTNSFYAHIEEMAVRGITLGCSASPPLYCPGDSVTRAQMAAFLVRAFAL